MPFQPRSLVRTCAVALALCSAAAAHADVTYTLTFDGTTLYGGDGSVLATYGGGFTVITPQPVTGTQVLAASACNLSASATPYLQCSADHVLDADGYGVGLPVPTGYAFIGFNVDLLAVPGAGFRGLLWFEPGSFSVNGVHNLSVGPLDPNGIPYGNSALSATLTVAGVVPEPASAALMALGVAGLLVARRRPA